ncbi:MAG: 2-dehydro-3-deoxyphosphogluconate aldolase [Chloroflexi bacterium RBG_13_50_21]|jgi:2-dehydro-3-deoxyphosphogluconate aldolase/(4S)-4-hydroxy-2-oxoglutarate aldolase|nr:MAG: 2-dehydro-3-deoxyphosphogluconate aldolase [Chloroflexi bacterium RBG_13_50_21]OGO62984.1 MAG: 2-dehydro-3-deoxyphosphogluconate aldolase [Chloroflexi bacterium RBG_19FT_COMBO_50_10]
MSKAEMLEKVKELGLLAVIRGPSAELTVKMVEALIEGGVLGIEITYSTPNAEEVVRTLSRMYGNRIVLGMGTLTKPEQTLSAKEAGAHYLVSPVCEPNLVKSMVDSGLLTMAGALTPTEVLQAYNLGVDVVKIFPGSLGGPAYVKALKGPFPYIPMMPTGGVSASNVAEWFATGVVAVGAGSELCPPQLAKEGKFDEITRRAAEFVQVVKSARA